jgi:hypothetical protein
MTKRFELLLSVMVLAGVSLIGCSKNHDELVVSNRPLNASTGLTEIALPAPLQYSHKVQEIQIELADNYEIVTSPSLQMRLGRGSAFMPQVELADSDNRHYLIAATSFWGKRVVFGAPYTYGDPITKVQIRSEQPIHIERVIWFCYDPDSFKR